MNKKKKIKLIISIVLIVIITFSCAPQIFHNNTGISTSKGTPGNGSIDNAYLIDYKLNNSKYFRLISYYFLGIGYMHSKLYQTLKDAYKECESTCPGIKFKYMEGCSRKGGKQLFHRTHRNGLSIDFMVPKIKNGKQYRFYDHIGLWHYLLEFDSDGKLFLNKKVSIDFETMAKQIIALDNAARKNGLKVKKVILKINLKDDFFSTKHGKEVKRRGIYFARYLPDLVDKMHDDHYHIDFEEL
jgi:penicillin-insensitive murein endopeptidase